MGKNKTLTIGNTDRYFNLHVEPRETIDNYVKVTRVNENRIEREMNKLERESTRYSLKDNVKYILYNEKYNNDRLINKLFEHGHEIRFYTNSTVPYYIVKGLAKHDNSSVVYRLHSELSKKEIENVALSFMATTVIIDVPVVIPHTNPYKVLDSLSYLKTNVDQVHVSFPRLNSITKKQEPYYEFDGEKYRVKPTEQVKYVEYLRPSLSIWRMYLYMITSTPQEHELVTELVEKIRSKRNTGAKK